MALHAPRRPPRQLQRATPSRNDALAAPLALHPLVWWWPARSRRRHHALPADTLSAASLQVRPWCEAGGGGLSTRAGRNVVGGIPHCFLSCSLIEARAGAPACASPLCRQTRRPAPCAKHAAHRPTRVRRGQLQRARVAGGACRKAPRAYARTRGSARRAELAPALHVATARRAALGGARTGRVALSRRSPSPWGVVSAGAGRPRPELCAPPSPLARGAVRGRDKSEAPTREMAAATLWRRGRHRSIGALGRARTTVTGTCQNAAVDLVLGSGASLSLRQR